MNGVTQCFRAHPSMGANYFQLILATKIDNSIYVTVPIDYLNNYIYACKIVRPSLIFIIIIIITFDLRLIYSMGVAAFLQTKARGLAQLS